MTPRSDREPRDYRGPSPPKAAHVAQTLKVLDELRANMERAYTELFDFAYSVGVPGPEFGRGQAHTSVSDPTGQTAVVQAKQRARRAAFDASERIADAVSDLRAAKDKMARGIPDPERISPDVAIFPRTASNDEVKQAHEAQERRRERGEL